MGGRGMRVTRAWHGRREVPYVAFFGNGDAQWVDARDVKFLPAVLCSNPALWQCVDGHLTPVIVLNNIKLFRMTYMRQFEQHFKYFTVSVWNKWLTC